MEHPRDKKLITIARNLRKNVTKQEKRLWYEFLSNYTVRFRRQEIIGKYIADFYCSNAKLVIEIDGSQHYETESMSQDILRTKYLQNLGMKVLRFTNNDINHNFEGVCYMIDEEVKARTSDPSVKR